MTQPNPIAANQAIFKLEYPQSLGVYHTYAEAQKAVDHLADEDFPVKNLAIVGTDLRLMERVTGRRTWGTVLGQGVMSGLSTGFIVAIFMMILFPTQGVLSQLLTALLIGVGIGLLFAVLGYALSRGQRDFTSVTQTVATKYELLCEHKVVGQARELLARAPGARAAQFNPHPQGWPQQGQGPAAWPQQSSAPWQQTSPAPGQGWPQQGGYPPPGNYGSPGSYPAPGGYGSAPDGGYGMGRYPGNYPAGGYPAPGAHPHEGVWPQPGSTVPQPGEAWPHPEQPEAQPGPAPEQSPPAGSDAAVDPDSPYRRPASD